MHSFLWIYILLVSLSAQRYSLFLFITVDCKCRRCLANNSFWSCFWINFAYLNLLWNLRDRIDLSMLKRFSVFRFEHGWLLFCIVATFHAIINFYFQRFSSSHRMLFLCCRSNDFRTITTLYAISIATYLLLFWVLRYAFLNNTSLRINVLAYVLVYRLKISHSTNKHLFKSSFSFDWHFVLLHFWMNVWECVCVHIYRYG